SWVSIREFSVHDRYAPRADLARGAPTTATSFQAAKPPGRATDGVTSTHWASSVLPTATAPQDLVADLGASRAVNTVRVFSQPDWGPRAVQVWVSPDSTTWTQVAAAALPNALGTELDVDEAVVVDLPDGLDVVREERRRRPEKPLVPVQRDVPVADVDSCEEVDGHRATLSAARHRPLEAARERPQRQVRAR